MAEVEMSGFGEMDDFLQNLQDTLEDFEGEHKLSDIFTDAFISSSTDFETYDSFLKNAPWDNQEYDDFEEIPDQKLNEYVQASTEFSDWDTMIENGIRNYLDDNL